MFVILAMAESVVAGAEFAAALGAGYNGEFVLRYQRIPYSSPENVRLIRFEPCDHYRNFLGQI